MDQAEVLLKEHFLKSIDLSDDEFAYVYSHFKPMSFKKGQAIISVGDDVDYEYFVIDGCLKSFFMNADLKMFILQFALPTWWASDFNALFYRVKATITVDCVTDTHVLALSHDNREKLCRELHHVENFFRWRTNKGYVAAHKRLLSYMNSDIQGRYEELLKQHPELHNLVPKQLIASYLGVSRETLSRFKR